MMCASIDKDDSADLRASSTRKEYNFLTLAQFFVLIMGLLGEQIYHKELRLQGYDAVWLL
jgi:hypothetical protein